MNRTQDTKKGATIQEVAQEANVSKSTVSLVLQGSDLIRSETAARVLEAARKLGYVYNRGAADLRRKGSRTIGVLINDLMNPFFTQVLVGLERRLVGVLRSAGTDACVVNEEARVIATNTATWVVSSKIRGPLVEGTDGVDVAPVPGGYGWSVVTGAPRR